MLLNRRIFLKNAAGAAAAMTAASSLMAPGAARAAGSGPKVVIVTGSPRRRGTSFLLAENFVKGAEEAGCSVFRFDSAFKRVRPCNGCDHCGLGSAPCVYKDDMLELNPYLIEADVIALWTPLYYFGFSAQIKTVIDRFYGINSQLHVPKRAMLLATAWNTNDRTMPALVHHYETLVDYMGWSDAGQILAIGCGTRAAIENSDFPRQAYELGRSIKA